MKKKLNNITIFFIILIVLNFMCLPAFADEIPAETDKDDVYITENTTLWDVVESTNPDAEEIPEEVKDNFKDKLVQSQNNNQASFVAISYEVINMAVLGVFFIAIPVGIFLKRKKWGCKKSA